MGTAPTTPSPRSYTAIRDIVHQLFFLCYYACATGTAVLCVSLPCIACVKRVESTGSSVAGVKQGSTLPPVSAQLAACGASCLYRVHIGSQVTLKDIALLNTVLLHEHCTTLAAKSLGRLGWLFAMVWLALTRHAGLCVVWGVSLAYLSHQLTIDDAHDGKLFRQA